MKTEVFGRDEEIAAIERHLGREREVHGSSALVLEGEAGIGKSTLLRTAVERACECGYRVLEARPAEREFGLAQAALGDLFEQVRDDVLPRLPAPQQNALRVALLLDDAGDAPPDPRAVAVAVTTALRLLAAQQPLALAIDDAHWLDSASSDALAFAFRRLDGADVHLILARRGVATTVEEAPRAVTRVQVGPLTVDAIRAVVAARTGSALARPAVVRLHELSEGNPFVAIELARADATVDPAVPLGMDAALDARLRDLPQRTQSALLVIAALGAPSIAVASRAGADPASLAPAAGDVVVIDGGEIRFAHPLLAAHVYARAADEQRRDVHRRLADLVDDPVARACHLEHSLDGADDAIAGELEEAAAVARLRGAPALAAGLAESAARMSVDNAARERRVLLAARDHLDAGSPDQARALALGVLDAGADRHTRANALGLLGEHEQRFGSLRRSVAYRREALELVPDVPLTQAMLQQRLAITTRFTEGLDPAEAHARATVELAETLESDALRACALATLAVTRFNHDEPDALALAESALEPASSVDDPGVLQFAATQLAHCLVFSGRLDRARSLLAEERRRLDGHDEQNERFFFWYLALVEQRHGNAELAGRYAARCREISLLYGGEVDDHPAPLFPAAFVAAFSGDESEARDLTGRALKHPDERDELTSLGRSHLALVAMLEHWRGDTASAAAHFDIIERSRLAAGYGFATSFWLADGIETLADAGHRDEAHELLAAWEQAARRTDDRWALAEAARTRGIIDLDVDRLEEAVELHAAAGDPFGRARALLVLGVAQRRARRRRVAREALAEAAAEFERVGSRAWAQRARGEQRRIGGRTPTADLTPAQVRVAELVANGSTNREVAARLFLSERTVENHLSQIYTKVGVRSRTQLARRWHEHSR